MAELISYTLTEIALAGIGMLSLIESIRLSADQGRFNNELTGEDLSGGKQSLQKRKNVITALQVETAVNFIAAFVYAQMITEYKKNPRSRLILQLRYADWVFTTPLLLTSLSLFLLKSERKEKKGEGLAEGGNPRYLLGFAVVLAVLMVVVGYRSEVKRSVGLAGVSFGLLALAFLALTPYLRNDASTENMTVFVAVFILWLCYGFVWFIKSEQQRNIAYNFLDLLSKVGFGFYLWLYMRDI